MKRIELTQNIYVFIDDEDFALVSQYKWHAMRIGRKWYAMTTPWDPKTKKQFPLLMHRLIMDVEPDQKVDHKKHYENYIDNRRDNLRICTTFQNNCNRRKRSILTSSQYKGVSWHKVAGKWQTVIGFNRKIIHLGLFNDEIEAARTYNVAVIKHFGEFAKLNDI